MKKGDFINGFRILEDFRVAGGMSKITFAERGGKEYFIKEFLYPKYPTPDSPGSEKIKAQKRKACEDFENHHRKLNNLIGTKVALGGNLVYAVAFFREGPLYYKVNEKIDTSSLSLADISSLPANKINIIARSVCHSVSILHGLDIVHGDLKPENILIKETSRDSFTGKLIDFDDSYFSKCPPEDKECIVGTPEYYSPELAAYIMDEDDEVSGETMTLASDIFTLGVILCEYYTGKKPMTGSEEPTWKAVVEGKEITFAKDIDPPVASLIKSMLAKDASARPCIRKVQNTLREIKDGVKPAGDDDKPPLKVELRGRGLSIPKPASTGEIKKEHSIKEHTSEKPVSKEPIGIGLTGKPKDPPTFPTPRKLGLRGKGLDIK